MTLAEGNLHDAKQHVDYAIRELGSILVWRTFGHDKFTIEQKMRMFAIMHMLMAVLSQLEGEGLKVKE